MQRLWYDWMAEGEHAQTGIKRRCEVSVIINLFHINVCLFLFYLKIILRKKFEKILIV